MSAAQSNDSSVDCGLSDVPFKSKLRSNMTWNRAELINQADALFSSAGSAVMKLTPIAAANACEIASERGFVVVRVEGGIWHAPGFEARIDCIWDGDLPPLCDSQVRESNREAANFIRSESASHSAFILTIRSNPESAIPR